MKTPQEKIEVIRRLIADYYDGAISPDDFDRLVRLAGAADSEILPDDIAEDIRLIGLLGDVRVAAADVPPCLEGKLRDIMADSPRKRSFSFYRAARPAAAAVAAIVFMTMWLSPDRNSDTDANAEPTIWVQLAAQVDDEPVKTPDIPEEPQTPLLAEVDFASGAVHPAVEEIEDNYIEITNYDQASILTQDAMSLLREKLAVAGYSLGSASVGLRQIDSGIRDIIAN